MSNYSPAWNADEDTVLKSLRATCTHKEISQVLGKKGWSRSPEAVRKRSRALNIKFFEVGIPISIELEQLVSEVRGEKVIPDLVPPSPVLPSQKAAHTTSQRLSTNRMFTELREIREEVDRLGRWPAINPEQKTGSEALVVLLSDFHVGKLVLDETGRVLFNVEIAIQRIDSVRQKIWELILRSKNKIDEMVIVLAGDLVDGEGIYPGQEMHLEVHVAEQIRTVTTSLWKLISDLAKVLSVQVVTCRGNHGRTGLSDEANWDNIIYQQLEILSDMTGSKSITVKNLYGNFNTFTVKGWKGLVRHNAPMQADTAGAIAKFAGWHSIHQYDFLTYGHWHHWGVLTWNGKPLFRNGSLGGGDDYAESFGACDDPTQLAFVVGEEELVKSIHPLYFRD